VHEPDVLSDEALISRVDGMQRLICGAQRELLTVIAEVDRRELWRDSGARDMAQWIAMRHGISDWKARRWLGAAHALPGLPRTAEAFSRAELGIDEVVELTRFAAPETEADLLAWARGVSPGATRRKADLAVRQAVDHAAGVDADRSVSWWYFDEGRRFGLEAELPAAEGAIVARALERLAERLPVMPGEEHAYHVHARRPTPWWRWPREGSPAIRARTAPRWSCTRPSRPCRAPMGRVRSRVGA
jgi:hypothetical protein